MLQTNAKKEKPVAPSGRVRLPSEGRFVGVTKIPGNYPFRGGV